MATPTMELLDRPEQVRTALSPPRRALLERLREPASATQLAAELGLPRQRVNYHLRALERAGLVELVEERRRRGCVERLMAASAQAFVVDPSMLAPPGADPIASQDCYAAEHLVGAAAGVVRDVARMRSAATAEGSRLLTFTIETGVTLSAPGDLERFTSALAEAAGEVAARFDSADGRRYRVLIAGHPAPKSADAEHDLEEDPT